jgi:hypothetical protein
VFARERARIRTSAAIGLAGFVASLAGAAALMRAQPVAMGIVALVAAFVAWRLLRNVRAALDALASALRAVPALGVEVRAPPAEPRRADDVPWTRVSAPSILGYGLLGVAAIAIACLAAEAAAPMSAHEIGMLFGGQLMFGPVVLAVVALLRSASVSLDGARREVRVARRILGIAYARTSVPLEIVSGFSLQKKREGRFKVRYVVADTSEGPLDLVSGEGAEKAVAALTSRFRAR